MSLTQFCPFCPSKTARCLPDHLAANDPCPKEFIIDEINALEFSSCCVDTFQFRLTSLAGAVDCFQVGVDASKAKDLCNFVKCTGRVLWHLDHQCLTRTKSG